MVAAAAVTAPGQGQDSWARPFPVSPCHGCTYLTVTVILSTSASRQLSIRVIDIERASARAHATLPEANVRMCGGPIGRGGVSIVTTGLARTLKVNIKRGAILIPIR